MMKYRAQVIYNIEIELPDESELNSEGWLKTIASNAAYHGHDEHAVLVDKEINITRM